MQKTPWFNLQGFPLTSSCHMSDFNQEFDCSAWMKSIVRNQSSRYLFSCKSVELYEPATQQYHIT